LKDLKDGNIEVVNEDIASFYKIMEIEYADSTLITQSLIIKFGEEAVYPLLHKLLEKGNTRYVSLSNASPNWIRKFKNEFGDKFFAHEGHLSYEVRALQDKGVLKACDELSIKNIIWRPLRRNKTLQHNWKLLAELAEKYSKTQSQIVLNWICHLGYAPMVFSTSQAHIDENITCNDFEMSAEDYKLMTDFRPTNYQPPQVDWEGAKIDDDIVVLANNFEEYLL
jgi:diketogulonate reductase-like aldo/keto reductase